MGRRGSITEARVFEAADALVAQGREVTPTVLLTTLGSGSFTTIYKHLSAWEASRVSAGTAQTSVIPEAVLSAFGAAWRAASAEAGKEVVTVREQAMEEVRTAQTQFQEALQTIERLEAESEIDAGRIEALTAKVAELEASLQKAETERAVLKATVEQVQQQVKLQEAELERVHREATSRADKADERAQKAEQSAAELRGKADTLKAQNDELLSRLTGQSKPQSKIGETSKK